MYKCKFSEKLNELRNTAGLTQAELAEAISVSDKVISKWENGMSTPDFNTLILLADYFGVTTDVMLGKKAETVTDVPERLREEFKKMNKERAVLETFRISKAFAPAMFEIMEREENVSDDWKVTESKPFRNCIADKDFYSIAVGSDDVNMAVLLLRNKNDFAWLNNPEQKQQIAELFMFLADEDTLSVCYYIHTQKCSRDFTVPYIAECTGVSEEKTKKILDASVGLGICAEETAHLLSGEIDIYNSMGEGNILALITLAYEHRNQCFSKVYDYNRNEGCKMIRGNGGEGNESV